MEEHQQYKVVRLLEELLPQAIKPTPSGVRLDCRLYFREKGNGDLWAEVKLVNPESGEEVHQDPGKTLPLEGDGVIPWYFGEIADRLFPMARELRTKPRA